MDVFLGHYSIHKWTIIHFAYKRSSGVGKIILLLAIWHDNGRPDGHSGLCM